MNSDIKSLTFNESWLNTPEILMGPKMTAKEAADKLRYARIVKSLNKLKETCNSYEALFKLSDEDRTFYMSVCMEKAVKQIRDAKQNYLLFGKSVKYDTKNL